MATVTTRLYVLVKMMKKIKSLIYIIIVCLGLGSCGQKVNNYEGKELIDRAAEIHTSYESAMVVVSDGEAYDEAGNSQKIEYRFEGEVMQYMYSAHVDGKSYYEFNNGTELNYITLPDETEWSFVAKGNEGYYNYSKASRHYFADGAQLFTDYEAAVSGSEIKEVENQTIIKLSYDLEKLKQYSALKEYGEFIDFSMVFYIDKAQGSCLHFRNDYTLADGKDYSYSVWIFERNPADPIVRKGIE